MRFVTNAGLWGTAAPDVPAALTALLEVSGAVLSWPVDDPAAADAPQIVFTDVRRADWLWRVLGESGQSRVAAALDGAAPAVELVGVDLIAGSTDRLRRLAFGHWLRRWWPASRRDGIAGLDPALLDAEIALLTAGAEDFFTDDTIDSDIGELLAPHPAALTAHVLGGDPRIIELARACADLASDIGVEGPGWAELDAALEGTTSPDGRRDNYALAAGGDTSSGGEAGIASGTDSVRWSAVPPGIFDAAEDTVQWTVETRTGGAVATVTVAVGGPSAATGVAVALQSGEISGAGVLDAVGRAVLPLVDAAARPITESAAWQRDWQATTATVGAERPAESPELRERIRRLARARLQQPAADAFLAEIVAAESDY
ncbi:hypothetical protein BH09ACT8_BH09ACT8_62950 [soil metagenome]